MLERILRFSFQWTVLLVALTLISGCSSQAVNLVHPQSGATLECSGSGFGLATAWIRGYIDECVRNSETRGYVPVDKLTPEQRLDLQRRGVLPKSAGIPASSS
jgi:hypothetical protein